MGQVISFMVNPLYPPGQEILVPFDHVAELVVHCPDAVGKILISCSSRKTQHDSSHVYLLLGLCIYLTTATGWAVGELGFCPQTVADIVPS